MSDFDNTAGFHPTLLLDNAREQVLEREPRWNWTSLPKCFWGCPIRPERDAAAKNENAIAIDCWKYGKNLDDGQILMDSGSLDVPCISQVRYINDESIESWTKQPIPTQDGELPRAGLRLLHICSDRYPFPDDILAAVARDFNIPRLELSISSHNSGVCATIFTRDLDHPVFICRAPVRNTAVTSVVRYDPSTNIAVGYILSGSASEIHFALMAIPTQFDTCEHPLLIPILMTEQFMEVLSTIIYGIRGSLNATERISADYIKSKPAGRNYFKRTAHWLSNETRSFALCQAQMHACILRSSYLEQQLDTLDTWMPPALLKSLQKSTSLLKQRIAFNKSNIEHLKVDSGVEIRLEALKTLLFNLVAQEDNQANIRLSCEMRQVAIKTKKDGSTMKLIAILGAIFLPATFVSTFFAMPLFDWNASSASEVVGNHFWVYWAVTGPLTLFTVILVGIWVMVRNRSVNEDGDNGSPPKEENIRSGQPDRQQLPSLATKLKALQVYETDKPNYSGHLSDRLGKAIKSALRLRNRQRDTSQGTEDEESRIR